MLNNMFGDDEDTESTGTSNWECDKCGGTDTETSEIATAGSKMQKLFDVQSQKFTVVTCQDCKYSELYATDSSKLEDAADLFL